MVAQSVTRLRIGIRFPEKTENFLLATAFRLFLGLTQPHIQRAPPGVKRPGREAYRSLSSVGEGYERMKLLPHSS
jgi:hypothetical protein